MKMDTRLLWFKTLACQFHWFPVLGCERCWNQMIDKFEELKLWEKK